MLYPIKVIDIELSQPIPTIEGLDGYMGVQGLVRLHGVPLGYVKAPISLGKCTAATLSKLILEEHNWAIICQLIRNGLASPDRPTEFTLENLINLPPVEFEGEWPLVTVAVCTRDRPDDIKLCLEAIAQLDYPNLDILVVDNAPTTESTKDLIDQYYPQVRYVREPRPGLDWARNRAILEAKGEIIAYTDDDVVVDRGWVKAIALAFSEHPKVMAVTGLVVPYELETEAQVLFEKYGGFGRGFEQQRYHTHPGEPMPWQWLGAGQFGTGANMAFRRSIFEKIGYFDPALDVGTPTNGCGDLEMFIRVLKSEHILIYEPQAVIRHRHRREYAQLKRQISFNGSLYALWIKLASNYADLRFSCLIIGIWWMLYWNMRRVIVSFLHRSQFPRDLVLAEFYGAFSGLTSYQKSKRVAASIVQKYGWQTEQPLFTCYNFIKDSKLEPSSSRAIAIREIELNKPLKPLTDLENYSQVCIYINWHNSPIGSLDYWNLNSDVLQSTLSREIVKKLKWLLLEPSKSMVSDLVWSNVIKSISNHYCPINEADSEPIPDNVSVSVVVGTFDRPDDLRNCLDNLQRQITNRKFNIIVVDNHPQSGVLPPLKDDFPEVIWVEEHRQGVAYARNAGINASASDIVITIDDDVIVPSDWMEKLIKPLADPKVMAVTGNILPIELETASQQIFEHYGGLGRGFETFSADGEWYDLFPHKPSPVWSLGGTANSAFRAGIFSHPEIGLMDEALGPGMPSGVGEDSYLFYKIIKAGYTIAYEPRGFVWHRHRRTMQALKKQIYNYSKGHVSHNLTTWLRDGDWRGLAQVLIGLPYAHYYRVKEYILKRSNYPISLIWLEIWGNLAGPWSLWRSRVRVHKQGRSQPYIPVNSRLD